MKRSMVVLVALVVVLAGLGGGVLALVFDGSPSRGGASDTEREQAAGEATEPPDEALAEFYAQEVDWQACPGAEQLECATVEVPVSYAEPDGDTIDIAVNRRPASGDSLGSLLVNPGGPGAGGTEMVAEAGSYFRTQLMERFDLVGFDPRGTGDSHPIDCVTDDELSALLAADPDPDTRAEIREGQAQMRRYWRGCEQKSGDLLGHVSTIEAARDMDVIRAALREPLLDYLGFSYGTRLGATYAELFPERVGRFVLDGGIDVSLDAKDDSLSQAQGFETALRAYVQNCLDGDDCFLGNDMDEALQAISDLLDDIEREPLPAGGGRTLEIGDALAGLYTPLYLSEYWSFLDRGLQAAQSGNGEVLQILADAYYRRENGEFQGNLFEVIMVINCLDDPWSIAPGEVDDHLPDFEEVAPTFASIFAWGLTGCRHLPVEPAEEPLDIRAEGAAPIVVVGTTRDPATPYEEAVALAKQLDSGVLLSRDGDGHLAYNKGNACVDSTIEAYLIDGEVPDDGTEC